MKTKILITFIGLALLVSCGTIRGSALKMSVEHVANIQTLEEIGGNIIKAWPAKSGALSAYLGPALDDASKKEIKKIMGDLDKLAAVETDKLKPKQKGEAVGYSARLVRLLGKEVFEKLLPDILGLIKPLL